MSVHQRHLSAFRPAPAQPAREVQVELCWRAPVPVSGPAPVGMQWESKRLPDTPLLRAAICTLARGAMLRCPDGPRAVEDLVPGDRVLDHEGRPVRVDWIGSMTLRPDGAGPAPLLRVAAGALGADGPEADVLLGAQAHVLVRSPACRALVGSECAFAPLAALADGIDVAPVAPPGAVTLYGLAAGGQHGLAACGLAVESFHPARAMMRSMGRPMLSEMAALFPQLAGGPGFGPRRIPHLSMAEAAELRLR